MPFGSGGASSEKPTPVTIDSTRVAELFEQLLYQNHIMNLHLSEVTGEVFKQEDTSE